MHGYPISKISQLHAMQTDTALLRKKKLLCFVFKATYILTELKEGCMLYKGTVSEKMRGVKKVSDNTLSL